MTKKRSRSRKTKKPGHPTNEAAKGVASSSPTIHGVAAKAEAKGVAPSPAGPNGAKAQAEILGQWANETPGSVHQPSPLTAAILSTPGPAEASASTQDQPLVHHNIRTLSATVGQLSLNAGSHFSNDKELSSWLNTQPREVSVIIAARAALRVLPVAALELPAKDWGRFSGLISTLFRATATARVAAKYPTRTNELRADATIGVGRAFATTTAPADRAAAAAAFAAAAMHADAAAAAGYAGTAAASAAVAAGSWIGVSNDANFLYHGGAVAELADSPLWRVETPSWALDRWAILKAALPQGEDWEVWTRWYDERLTGAPSRGEAYELVFATVPLPEWDAGYAAANRWIKKHLPKEPKTSEASWEKGQGNELLKQKAAPFAFHIINGKIDVAAEDAVSIDEQVARDFHAEARRKAAELKERLARAQGDKRLQGSLSRLEEYLGENVDDIRPGLILSALRSLESDHRAYDTEEGRKEHAPDLLAMLDDVAGTVRDLAAAYPKTREIIANQFALDLEEKPASLEKLEAASDRLADAAKRHPKIIAPAAAKALREPGKAISESRTLKDRAGQLALRLLSDANFLRVIASSEIVRDTGREISKIAPPAVATVVAIGIALGGAYGIGVALGTDGLALIKDVAATTKELFGALEKPSGDFDMLSKKIKKLEDAIEKQEASKAASASPKTSTKPAKKELPPTKTPGPAKPTKEKLTKK